MQLTNTQVDPLDIDTVKAHLVVNTDVDDQLIQTYTDASLEQVELYLHKRLLIRTFVSDPAAMVPTPESTLVLDLPEKPSIVTLTFSDQGMSHRLILQPDQYVWKDGLLTIPVTTSYTYNEVTAEVGVEFGQRAILQARLLLIGNFYSFREDAVALRLNELPNGVRAILDSITGGSL